MCLTKPGEGVAKLAGVLLATVAVIQ